MSTNTSADRLEVPTTSPGTPPNRLAFIRSLDVLKVLAGCGVVAGLLFHLMGTVWYDTYHQAWGVDAGSFPKPVDRLVISGFTSVLLSALHLWPLPLDNALEAISLALLCSVMWQMNTWVDQRLAASDQPPEWLSRGPTWLWMTLLRFLLVLFVLVFAAAAVWLVAVVLAMPIKIASTAAKDHARAERTAFLKGCAPTTSTRCIELRRGAEVVGRGPLIDSSADNVAFFDVALAKPRVVQRAGLELIGELKALP